MDGVTITWRRFLESKRVASRDAARLSRPVAMPNEKERGKEKKIEAISKLKRKPVDA